MPPACTRNRAILYGVPWLAAFGTVAAALMLRPAQVNALASGLLFGSVLLVGLPHGSADWWVMRWMAASGCAWFPRWMATSGRHWFLFAAPPPEMLGRSTATATNGARRSPSTRALVWLNVAYTTAILVTLAFWRWQPGWALAGFMALTVWHFGSAEASVLLPEKTPFRTPVWWLFGVGRGLLVIFTSLAFWPAQSALVLMPFASLGHGTGEVIAGLLRSAPTLLWLGAGLQTAGLFLEIRTRFAGHDQRSMAFEGLETGVLLLLFRVAPPLLSFACYWIAFHAWRHLLRMETVLHPDSNLPLWRAVVDFHRRTLPLTLLSLLGFALIFLVWPSLLRGTPQIIAAYLILLSALTVPHALVIGWLDARDGSQPSRESW